MRILTYVMYESRRATINLTLFFGTTSEAFANEQYLQSSVQRRSPFVSVPVALKMVANNSSFFSIKIPSRIRITIG